MAKEIAPFLMFEGRAEEAMDFYVRLFDNVEIIDLQRWGTEGPGTEGKVMSAAVSLAGTKVMFFDSPTPHAFTFTPSFSFFVTCESEQEIERLNAELGESGKELMPLGSYGFSTKFCWVSDRFGVSWQLNLP